MALIDDAYIATSNLNWWIKVQEARELTLADIRSIISLRWPWLWDNWEFFKPSLIAAIGASSIRAIVIP
jgi:hypothetical protein